MEIWKLERDDDDVDYDEYSWHIIVVNNLEEAKKYAKDISADEWPNIWETARTTLIWYTTDCDYMKKWIVLSDFNAG